ncbi:MAG: heavy-metal-associated domain-containing protein [Phycisphaerales bacterium]|jgi:copper chaperone CopZ|nr:heavy-metal-associated domain-containing protein [Phycisphaerales bacterium]
MSHDVGLDQLALIRIEGMHCHRCEQAIQKSLEKVPGVHEVEVDFNSGQASVLFHKGAVTLSQLADVVSTAGYRVTGFSQRDAEPGEHC